ncbi:hypothetical protein H0H81_001115 [Sphagnurus paluster]|uniref:BTB domain-containing protein n=1 Tax=Sphagnurus paluster TaxID=117069 RepID=A0A9P7FW27_9AGAR|nr:hypothetical protein H0H81_001115 [Sphagnurus paluster]
MSLPMSSQNQEFVDGDIDLLIAGHKHRIHKAILSENSEVFADLFALADPSADAPEEIAVIELHDDEEPFKILLHILYGHELAPYIPFLSRNTISLISRTLDLADKYNIEVPPLHAKLIPFIQRDWPDTLVAWDAMETHIAALEAQLQEDLRNPAYRQDPDTIDVLDTILPEPASVIRFSTDYKPEQARAISSYIPAALYHLARLPPYIDVDDPTMNGGVYWDFDEIVRSAKRGLLTRTQLMCLMIGIDALRLNSARFAFKEFPTAVAEDEVASEAEKTVIRKWWMEVGIEKMVGPYEMPDPLARMRELIEELRTSTELEGAGSGFRERMRVVLEKERQEVWDGIVNGGTFCLFMFFYPD